MQYLQFFCPLFLLNLFYDYSTYPYSYLILYPFIAFFSLLMILLFILHQYSESYSIRSTIIRVVSFSIMKPLKDCFYQSYHFDTYSYFFFRCNQWKSIDPQFKYQDVWEFPLKNFYQHYFDEKVLFYLYLFLKF